MFFLQIGKVIMMASGQTNLKRTTLELGGKSPNVIFADADCKYPFHMSHITREPLQEFSTR